MGSSPTGVRSHLRFCARAEHERCCTCNQRSIIIPSPTAPDRHHFDTRSHGSSAGGGDVMRMILFDFELINVRARRMRHRLTPDRTDQAREEAERSATSPPMDCYPVDCFAEPEQERCCTCNQRSIIIPSSTDHRFCARASAQPFTDRSPIPSTKQASTNQVVEPSLEIRAIFSTAGKAGHRWRLCCATGGVVR